MSKATEYCVEVFDGTHESPKPCEKGYKLLTSKNIMNGYLDKTDAYFISEEDYTAINQRSLIRKWDILFSMIGTVGNVCLITDDNIDFAIKNMGVFSCRDEYKAKWLYFYLKSPYVTSLIQNYLNGAVQKFLSLGKLRELEIPDLDENKKKIVDLLWGIEEKINNNNKINYELEEMAKTIYKYWFLQFDFPNEDGTPYKSSGGKMVWSEELKREIPEGWEIKRLSDLSKMELTSVLPHKHKIYRHYSIPAFDDRRMPILEQGESIASNKYIVPNNAILVSKLNPQFKRIWLLEEEVRDGICSTEFIPFVSVSDNREFLFLLLNSDGFYTFMMQSSSSSTGSRKRMQPELMGEYRLAYPQDKNILSVFKNMMQPNLEKTIRIREENQELIGLRDFLLPLLMNGQVSFKDTKLKE